MFPPPKKQTYSSSAATFSVHSTRHPYSSPTGTPPLAEAPPLYSPEQCETTAVRDALEPGSRDNREGSSGVGRCATVAPAWYVVDPLQGTVLPGEKLGINFRVLVRFDTESHVSCPGIKTTACERGAYRKDGAETSERTERQTYVYCHCRQQTGTGNGSARMINSVFVSIVSKLAGWGCHRSSVRCRKYVSKVGRHRSAQAGGGT